MPPNTVKVDRSTEWGNPFQVADIIDAYDGNQAMAQLDVACSFEQWLHESEEGKQMAKRAKELLRGKDLACWCKCGSPCHADVLLRVANARADLPPASDAARDSGTESANGG